MAEGLSVSEVAKELEHHRHHAEPGPEHQGRLVPLIEALLLSVVTVVTAWAGYSAAKWSTESRLGLAEASTLRSEANRASLSALETRNFDSSTFDAWFTAYTLGDAAKMDVAERRFRPDFQIAFDAWWATDPENNPAAPPGPTFMPAYRQPDKVRAEQLDRRADDRATSGERDGATADDYVRITVLLAAVLFLVGIGTQFQQQQVRYLLVSVGALCVVAAVVALAQQPRPP